MRHYRGNLKGRLRYLGHTTCLRFLRTSHRRGAVISEHGRVPQRPRPREGRRTTRAQHRAQPRSRHKRLHRFELLPRLREEDLNCTRRVGRGAARAHLGARRASRLKEARGRAGCDLRVV